MAKSSKNSKVNEVLISKLEELAKDYRKKKDKAEELEKNLKAIKQEAMDLMKELNVEEYDFKKVSVHLSTYNKLSFDTKTFKAEEEDLYNSYLRESSITNFLVKRK